MAKQAKVGTKTNEKMFSIDPDEIVAVVARGNYVLLRRMDRTDLLRVPMLVLAETLRAYGFVRIHRSVMINASFVEEIRSLNTGDNLVRVKGGVEYRMTRTYKKNLQGSWLLGEDLHGAENH